MSKLAAGGGSGAAEWAAHAVCERYRGTDALVTGKSRRALAEELGAPDDSAAIPQARWTRAMIFERLCHDPAFAGEVAARASGWSGFDRPTSVTPVDCGVSTTRTLEELAAAVERAADGGATLLSRLAVPFPGVGAASVTGVLPDLGVVALGPAGPTLIVGDVKDYERVRSRLDDGRLLKGFLQVAMGALGFMTWRDMPAGLKVSTHGFLAVPRSVFLQPTVEVEDLSDHLQEVREQVRLRADVLAARPDRVDSRFVRHLRASFDPAACPSCSLHNYCRSELRKTADPAALFVEVGVPENERASVEPLLRGQPAAAGAKARTVQMVTATMTGRAAHTRQRRLDPADTAGAVDVVVAKSDSAALGFHGIGVRRHHDEGTGDWQFVTFEDPQSDVTRRRVMALVGAQLEFAIAEGRKAGGTDRPVHVVVPDAASADLLASTADLLAGVELSRLRWKRDIEMGRPPLTYNGEPATVPKALTGERRTAVSFLLEHDRARMLSLRSPVVDMTSVMRRHFVPGGPAHAALRLDYVVDWAEAEEKVDFRTVGDKIERSPHTPGARLANRTSDALNAELEAVRGGGAPDRYRELVEKELRYKAEVLECAMFALEEVHDSKLQAAVRSFEGDAQAVWRRRMRLQASDLVRFGRTYPHWRNRLVTVIEADRLAFRLIYLLANPQLALEAATDAGVRDVARARVVTASPLTVAVEGRQVGDGAEVVLLAANGEPWLETDAVLVSLTKGAVQLHGFPTGRLESGVESTLPQRPGELLWLVSPPPGLAAGDELLLARLDAFDAKQRWFNIARPQQDDQAAPKTSCDETSYPTDSDGHQWCCRPHSAVEADFADKIAARRGRNELNPQVWPPVHDSDGFEVPAADKPTSRDVHVPPSPPPEGVTTDELE